jgi:hypothetical protein
MWIEVAKPVALLLCILSLYAVFHAAFLIPASELQQRITDSLERLALAGAIAFVGGALFYKSEPQRLSSNFRFSSTLPLRIFYWTTGAMLLLFLVSWYLESHCIFYRDVRPLR